ncbi:MAG: hypothetical protein ACFFDP_11830, partial [Promethearchaeota archaeon]
AAEPEAVEKKTETEKTPPFSIQPSSSGRDLLPFALIRSLMALLHWEMVLSVKSVDGILK